MMDRIILKKADNINLIDPEIPSEDIDPYQPSDMKNRYKNKKKRWRNEPSGYHEVLLDGRGDERDKHKGFGTDVSYDVGSSGEVNGM
jgi:hypothetical protein